MFTGTRLQYEYDEIINIRISNITLINNNITLWKTTYSLENSQSKKIIQMHTSTVISCFTCLSAPYPLSSLIQDVAIIFIMISFLRFHDIMIW